MNKKKRFISKLMICALTAVTLLTSNATVADVQAATPKAMKVKSFDRSGKNTATVKFKKQAKATKYQVRYSFYQDFRKGFTETSKSMTLPKKGKSKKYKTASKKYTTITTPKSGSYLTVKIQDPRLQKITYNYQAAKGCNIIIDDFMIDSSDTCDSRDYVYKSASGYGYVGFYCAVQIRYYNKGWSKWSKTVRLYSSPRYTEKETKKELSRTPYFVCGDGYPAGTIASDGTFYNGCGLSVSRKTYDSNPDYYDAHFMECPYNKWGSFRNADLVKYSVTCTWK